MSVEGMKNHDNDQHEAKIARANQGCRSHADWVAYIEYLQGVDCSMGIMRMPDYWPRILINRMTDETDIKLALDQTHGHLNDFNFVREKVLLLDCGMSRGSAKISPQETADDSDNTSVEEEEEADLRPQPLWYDNSREEAYPSRRRDQWSF